MRGRPTKLTEEREADLVLLLAAGVPTGVAARSVSVSERSVERWLRDGLRERVAEARATGQAQTDAMNEHDLRSASVVARVEWRTARTVENFPHAYYVQPKDDAEEFFAFVTLINREGEPRSFGKTRYRYLEVGEHVYWVSRSWYDRGALIVNRRLAADDQGARFDGTNYA